VGFSSAGAWFDQDNRWVRWREGVDGPRHGPRVWTKLESGSCGRRPDLCVEKRVGVHASNATRFRDVCFDLQHQKPQPRPELRALAQVFATATAPGFPTIDRNSRRVDGSVRNVPSMRDVTIVTPALCTPRVDMH
jgi:hypothetical protein